MATIRPTSVPTKRLSSAITSGATSFQLTDILGWDGAALTSASFGTKAYGVFRDATNAHIELFEFDPSTIASSSITINLRGLKFDGDLTTEVSGNKRSWTKGTLVELGTHVPQLFRHYVDTLEAQTIAGVKTFSALPATTAGNPVSDNDLVRKAYADAILAGGSGIPNRVVVAGNAGATVSAGQLVYLDVADGEWKLCDADTAASVDNIILGIAQGAGTDGNSISGGVLLFGLDSNQTGLTDNTAYYASNTAGAISSSVGTTEVSVGISRSTTSLLFYPRYNQQLTENQQDALAGDNGTPSSSNTFVTQTGFQRAQEVYAADSVGSDSYAVTLSPVPAAYVTGMVVRFKAGTANTGACTLNVNSLGATSIKKRVSADLDTGDILANQIVEVVYDGTNFQLISTTSRSGGTSMQVFSASGTWTRPTGVTQVDVEVVGGGGSGGGTGTAAGNLAGGGGGAGGYARALVTVSGDVTVTVGTGGAGASNGTNNGNNSSFAGGTTITANGGSGGSANNSTNSEASGGGGGSTTNGTYAATGQSGESGLKNTSVTEGGAGGSNPLGFGARTNRNSAAAGSSGTGYGAGGSGSTGGDTTARAGGSGTDGVVIVRWNS